MMRHKLRLPFMRAWRISTSRKRWPGTETDLDHHATNQDLDQRLVGENSSSGGLPQSESLVVEGADAACLLCWELLVVGGGPPEIFQQEPAFRIWIHMLCPARIQSSRELTVC